MYHNGRHKLFLFFFEQIVNTNIHICDKNVINTLSTYCPIKSINIITNNNYKRMPDLIPNVMPLLGTADSGMAIVSP